MSYSELHLLHVTIVLAFLNRLRICKSVTAINFSYTLKFSAFRHDASLLPAQVLNANIATIRYVEFGIASNNARSLSQPIKNCTSRSTLCLLYVPSCMPYLPRHYVVVTVASKCIIQACFCRLKEFFKSIL
jgi:hypothetical protein